MRGFAVYFGAMEVKSLDEAVQSVIVTEPDSVKIASMAEIGIDVAESNLVTGLALAIMAHHFESHQEFGTTQDLVYSAILSGFSAGVRVGIEMEKQ